jgi:hypothetical protein
MRNTALSTVLATLLLATSCATLRLQTISDSRLPSVQLSRFDDIHSLSALMNNRKEGVRPNTEPPSKLGDGTFLVGNQTKCWILEETRIGCRGRSVFTKVRIVDGPEKDTQGWVCGAFISHRKGGVM